MSTNASLAELLIVAASEAWRDNGEVLASGIGVLPRLGASLAKLTHSPDLLMTDSETMLAASPIPLGPRDAEPLYEGHLPFARVFDCVWGGKRHAMIGPTQIDRFGQANLSVVGGTYEKPKAAILGVRGLPGNNIHHANSYFIPRHSKRVFVEGEVDMVSGCGYNPARFAAGMRMDWIDLRCIITDLCVMDFGGPDHAIRVRSLHPGVSFETVQSQTGFELLKHPQMTETSMPTAQQLDVIASLDPKDLRARQIKNNPSAVREGASA